MSKETNGILPFNSSLVDIFNPITDSDIEMLTQDNLVMETQDGSIMVTQDSI